MNAAAPLPVAAVPALAHAGRQGRGAEGGTPAASSFEACLRAQGGADPAAPASALAMRAESAAESPASAAPAPTETAAPVEADTSMDGAVGQEPSFSAANLPVPVAVPMAVQPPLPARVVGTTDASADALVDGGGPRTATARVPMTRPDIASATLAAVADAGEARPAADPDAFSPTGVLDAATRGQAAPPATPRPPSISAAVPTFAFASAAPLTVVAQMAQAAHVAAAAAQAAAAAGHRPDPAGIESQREPPPASALPAMAVLAAPAAMPGAGALPATALPEGPPPSPRDAQFPEQIGARLGWMAGQNIGHAHIKLAPAELGPLEIRLRLDGDRIHADFSSAQPEVRLALEHGMPRLRELLGQQGFQLAHADVGQQHQPAPAPAMPEPATAAEPLQEDGARDGAASSMPVSRGLLDTYA